MHEARVVAKDLEDSDVEVEMLEESDEEPLNIPLLFSPLLQIAMQGTHSWSETEVYMEDDTSPMHNTNLKLCFVEDAVEEDSEMCVEVFQNDCESDAEDYVAGWMAAELVKRPFGFGESCVYMSSMLPVHSQKSKKECFSAVTVPRTYEMEPCLRRRFPRCLKPPGRKLIEDVYPMDCFPPSQAVAAGTAPCKESLFVSQPHIPQTVISTQAAERIQKHWSFYLQLKQNKVSQPTSMMPLNIPPPPNVLGARRLVRTPRRAKPPVSTSTQEADASGSARLPPQSTGKLRRHVFGSTSFSISSGDSYEISENEGDSGVIDDTVQLCLPTPSKLKRRGFGIAANISTNGQLPQKTFEDKESVESSNNSSVSFQLVPSVPPLGATRRRTFGTSRISPNMDNRDMTEFSNDAVCAGPSDDAIPNPQPPQMQTPPQTTTAPQKPRRSHSHAVTTKLSSPRQSPNPSSCERHISGIFDSNTLSSTQRSSRTSGAFRHTSVMKDAIAISPMDGGEDPVVLTQAVWTSSFTRVCRTPGAAMHNLDGDVEVKKQRSSKTKSAFRFVSESQRTATPPNCDLMIMDAPTTPKGKVLGALRRRGSSAPLQPSMDLSKGKSAMELDLGMSTTSISRDSNQNLRSNVSMPTAACSVLEPRKPSGSPNLLPSLTAPGNTTDNIRWSIKMAYASAPRGVRKSSVLIP